MRKIVRALPVLLLALLLAAAPATAAWSTVRQVEGAERVLVEVGGHKRAYWKLDAGRTMEVTVTGPAVLRVYSRTEWKLSYKDDPYAYDWSVPGAESGSSHHQERAWR